MEQKRFSLLTVSQNLVWCWPTCIGTDILMARGRIEVISYFLTGNSFWLVSVDRELHCYSHSLYFIFPGVITLAVAWEPEVSCLLASVDCFCYSALCWMFHFTLTTLLCWICLTRCNASIWPCVYIANSSTVLKKNQWIKFKSTALYISSLQIAVFHN